MLKKEITSFAAAFKGLFYLLKKERHFIIHIVIMLLVIIAGFYFHLSQTEWVTLCLTFGLVICAEAFNTAIEKLCDVVHPEYHKSIGLIKDIAAAGVLFAAIIAIIIGCLLFIPKII
ncbi:MAG TPA: diacylglycerol kinase family protein [Chitinophagales bacterium]|nr:diacylglycerol kinase family protein [Chitinophagales bacterium]HRG84981.1 diacylglycerol kinase family protein [Chitinophagales bacterium]HRH53214.1 diacylglycerol kinase family protein [Chitinophagales bacterium]